MTTEVLRVHVPRARLVWPGLVTLAAGSIALLSRPISDLHLVVTAAVGVAAFLHPVADDRESRAAFIPWFAIVAAGVAAFAIARVKLGGSLIPPPTGALMTAAVVAAVAEEAFFRRFAYAVLSRWSVPAAVAGSSLLFAIVHVPTWGWPAFPIDLAAGALLGWQRWATGSWTAPAVTHVAANVLLLL